MNGRGNSENTSTSYKKKKCSFAQDINEAGKKIKMSKVVNRVTRLGECSTIGWLFTLVSYQKLQKWRKFLDYVFPTNRPCVYFDKKWVGQHFWATFSQTHLVTLVVKSSEGNS
jgi:hypothetical protein